MRSIGLVSQKRLKNIPASARLSHEYCYFLHDQCVQVLKEYEKHKAHHITFKFKKRSDKEIFETIAGQQDAITAMRSIGAERHAKRLVVNQTTFSLTSDCLHHIYEALSCLERRKAVVSFNLLRKPLTDSLHYLTWMLLDEDDFYKAFSKRDAKFLAIETIGKARQDLFKKADQVLGITQFVKSDYIINTIYRKNSPLLQYYFQHAVHLITTFHSEIKTTPENFNFIFKSPNDDDIYLLLYSHLPKILFFLCHVIMRSLDRMHKMERGAQTAFGVRSRLGLYLSQGGNENNEHARKQLLAILSPKASCRHCQQALLLTNYNMARITLSDSFRCTYCRKTNPFPFSWIF